MLRSVARGNHFCRESEGLIRKDFREFTVGSKGKSCHKKGMLSQAAWKVNREMDELESLPKYGRSLGMKISLKVGVLSGLHFLARGFFKARGFKWEVRRAGEMQLGYWKMKLHGRNPNRPYPRRFVLIPGFGDTPLSWYPVTALLRPWLMQHYDEVILFDFPGFGGFLSKERSFPTMDKLISATADALDSLKPAALMGHSLGGGRLRTMRPTVEKDRALWGHL